MLQFEPLESACVQYLTSQALKMTNELLMCLAQLGDHLGLSGLFDDSVHALIQKPWVDNMHRIAQILVMPVFQQDIAKIDELLHHPGRGAYTELQVLQLLEMADMSQNNIAAVFKMDTMQPAEFDTLLGILVNTKHAPSAGMLLCKAVQQHRLPESLQPCPDWTACTRIVHNVMMPDKEERVVMPLPHSAFYLIIDHTCTMKDGEQMLWQSLLVEGVHWLMSLHEQKVMAFIVMLGMGS